MSEMKEDCLFECECWRHPCLIWHDPSQDVKILFRKEDKGIINSKLNELKQIFNINSSDISALIPFHLRFNPGPSLRDIYLVIFNTFEASYPYKDVDYSTFFKYNYCVDHLYRYDNTTLKLIYKHLIKTIEFYSKPIRKVPPGVRYQVLNNQHWRCNICYIKLKYSNKTIKPDWIPEEEWHNTPVAQIDHIHPFADYKTYPGGFSCINERSNLQALCPSCNSRKMRSKQ